MKTLALSAAALAVIGSPLYGATAFLSTTGFGGGASVGNPDVSMAPGDPSLDLHIYFVPEPGDSTFVGISVGVTSSTAGVADFTGFIVLNPDILVGAVDVNDRWDGTGGSLVNSEEISNLSGVSISSAGLDVANDGSGVFLDAGFDSSAGAYYFGVVTLDPVGVGSTNLSLSVGSTGIARAGDIPLPTGPVSSITFGAAEPTSVTGDAFGATGTVFDATINVIPEPSTALLLSTSLLLIFRRRRTYS